MTEGKRTEHNCRVPAWMLMGIGIACIGISCIFGNSMPVFDMLSGFGLGILMTAAARTIWNRVRRNTSDAGYNRRG